MRKRREYLFIRKNGRRLVGSLLSIDYLEKWEGEARLGITASGKFGAAHERNRFKRVVREIFRLAHFSRAFDLHVSPRHLAKEASFHQISEELLSLIAQCYPH